MALEPLAAEMQRPSCSPLLLIPIAFILLAGCAARVPAQQISDEALLPAVLEEPPVLQTAPPRSDVDAGHVDSPRESPASQLATSIVSVDDRYEGLRIDDLSARSYGGSGIAVGDLVTYASGYRQYEMTYESDGLTITGLVDIPEGEGPFPVILVNHGYLRPVDYEPGTDSWRIAAWLALHGYITLMSDYRNYGGAATGPNPFHIGYAIDVMNLAAQTSSLPQAAPGKIGIIGHSMGGEISMWPMVISAEVDAVVLYSAMSGDVARNWAHARYHWPAQRAAMEALGMVYGLPEDYPEEYAAMSPINYLNRIQMPVMIHHGTQDNWVPFEWSEELFGLMQDAGIDATFWSYPGGGHTLRGPDYDLLMQRTLEFFEENVRGDERAP